MHDKKEKPLRDNFFDIYEIPNRIYTDPDDPDYLISLENNLLYGHTSPDMTTRFDQRPKRKTFLTKTQYHKFVEKAPRLTDNFTQKENYLSEVESLRSLNLEYKHLRGIGNKSADDLYSVLMFLVWKTNYLKDPFWDVFTDILQRRAKGNAYQGKWRFISEILEMSSSKIALFGFIKSKNFKKRYFNSLLTKGERLAATIKCCGVIDDPIRYKQFKRGFSDNRSDKNSSDVNVNQEQEGLYLQAEWDLNLVGRIPSEAESITRYIYGFIPMPKRKIILSEDLESYINSEKYERDREKRLYLKQVDTYRVLFDKIAQGYYNPIKNSQEDPESLRKRLEPSLRHVPKHLRKYLKVKK